MGITMTIMLMIVMMAMLLMMITIAMHRNKWLTVTVGLQLHTDLWALELHRRLVPQRALA